jgi:hypothetical protein
VASELANRVMPHGPDLGCQVAPCGWLVWCMQKFWSPQESNWRPPLQAHWLKKVLKTNAPNVLLGILCHFNLNKVKCKNVGRNGVGAKPQPMVLFGAMTIEDRGAGIQPLACASVAPVRHLVWSHDQELGAYP